MVNKRPKPHSILLAGATGTIGRAVMEACLADGHQVTCLVRKTTPMPVGVAQDIVDFEKLTLPLGSFDAVISCIASRSGNAADAWAVDHDANLALLTAAQKTGIPRFTQLSAICVQTPELAFQQAKLAFEETLQESGLDWTIIRPTAFFKSLSGQVKRVQRGKAFLVFGNGQATSCKPISDRDLARFILDRTVSRDATGQVLPIGGPGPAISPLDQVEMLSELTGRTVPVRRVPFWLMDGIVLLLSLGGTVSQKLAAKAALARIGRFYARTSMLVWDERANAFSAEATPEFGKDRLKDHYAALLAGDAEADLGAHGVFDG